MSFVIAIDGHAASGKGTIAKGVATYFGLPYLDTGLIYRAVAQLAQERQRPVLKEELIDIARSFKPEFLELENLRSDEVGIHASKIAAISEVRSELIKFQRNFASKYEGAVLDGRDIGTVIVPDAQVKLFITADLKLRAKRRFKDLFESGIDTSLEVVLNDLRKRDLLDSNRLSAPLKISDDAHLIDTSELSIEASIVYVVDLVRSLKKGN